MAQDCKGQGSPYECNSMSIPTRKHTLHVPTKSDHVNWLSRYIIKCLPISVGDICFTPKKEHVCTNQFFLLGSTSVLHESCVSFIYNFTKYEYLWRIGFFQACNSFPFTSHSHRMCQKSLCRQQQIILSIFDSIWVTLKVGGARTREKRQ